MIAQNGNTVNKGLHRRFRLPLIHPDKILAKGLRPREQNCDETARPDFTLQLLQTTWCITMGYFVCPASIS